MSKELSTLMLREKFFGKNYNEKFFQQLCTLKKQCLSKTNKSEEELKQEIPILRGEKNLNQEKLKLLRQEIRTKLVKITNDWSKYWSYYHVGEIIYAIYCISYSREGMKGVEQTNSRAKFCINYLACCDLENSRQVKKAIKNLKLLDGQEELVK